MRIIFISGNRGFLKQDNRRNVALGCITLMRHVFDFFDYPFVGTRITLHNSNNAFTAECVKGRLYTHMQLMSFQ